jgi:hypothetical protein
MPTVTELTDIHQRLGRLLVAGVDWSPEQVRLIESARQSVSAATLEEARRRGIDIGERLRQSTSAAPPTTTDAAPNVEATRHTEAVSDSQFRTHFRHS